VSVGLQRERLLARIDCPLNLPTRGAPAARGECVRRVTKCAQVEQVKFTRFHLTAFGKPQTSTMRFDILSALSTVSQSSTLTGRPFSCLPSLVSG
jgi:hypothetical protein